MVEQFTPRALLDLYNLLPDVARQAFLRLLGAQSNAKVPILITYELPPEERERYAKSIHAAFWQTLFPVLAREAVRSAREQPALSDSELEARCRQSFEDYDRQQRLLAVAKAKEERDRPSLTATVERNVQICDLRLQNCYDLALTRRLAPLGAAGGTLVDIGANVGYFSLLWAALHPRNRCVAFEASPRNVELINRNVRRNGLGDRIDVRPQAAGRDAGAMDFVLGAEDVTGWGGFVLQPEQGSIRVDVVRVDEAVGPGERIDVLKIDVEGADTWVLMGCEKLLRDRRIGRIYSEQNKPRMRGLGIRDNEATEYLRSPGYRAVPQSNPGHELVDWLVTPADEAL